MPEPPSLPASCTLRPATAADKLNLQQLLKNLEREIAPETVELQRRVWAMALGLAVLTIGSISLPIHEVRAGLQALLGAIGLASGLVLAATWLLQQRDWQHYWVVEYKGYLVACAKLQRHATYAALFDLYVVPDWRRQGVGSCLVRAIEQQAPKPLYLACLPGRLAFYQRLGFAPVPPKRLSPLIRYDLGLPTRPHIIPMVRL